MARKQLLSCLIVFTITVAFVQQSTCQGSRKVNPCLEQKTCGACIAASPECAWCTQEQNYDRVRCDIYSNLVDISKCDDDYIIRPDHEADFVKDLPPQNAEDGNEAIQMSPQEIHLKIRPNKPYTFRVNYRQAENYPVDLYYIMDLSYSMRDDKSKVAELGDLLSEEMVKITKNFRLGFGSFIDKKTMPYVSTVPKNLRSPCEGCVAPYGFKNQLPLTDDTSQFRNTVLQSEISGNLDSPEGGFDAMMQAIACQQIGWRERSRKLLVFSTDAGFHFAGDGLLGGIVKPNDGACHLDTSGYYSESLNQDYPSISQIAKKVSDNNVNVIFAVTADRLDIYHQLEDFIEGSVVGELANDSSNVVELVKENYEEISGMVELKADAPEGVHVSFTAYCLNGEPVRGSGKCDKVGIGQNVSYEVTVEVRECPADAESWQQTLTIYPIGLSERLDIQLDMICECECEGAGFEEPNSPKCNGTGTYECGACTCDPGHYGKTCECDGSKLQTDDYDALCKMTNTSEVCDGHGECVCGVCDCYPVSSNTPFQKYSGDFCDCNNYACDYYDDKICGGPERGLCNCGECACVPEYTGSACECPVSQEPCRASNGKICNDKGTCICGKCTCDKDNYFYRGDTCEDCPTCPGKCEANKDCVQCMVFQTGNIDDPVECKKNCSHIETEESVEENDNWRKCRFRDDDQCFFYFSYQYDGDRVVAQRERECPVPLKVGWIIFGIILLILLIGLLILCLWKIFVTIYDRREYARFEKEVEKAKWDMAENPIFKPATSTYTNPMKKD